MDRQETVQELSELEKLEEIVQQAANIQIAEVDFSMADSDGNAIEGTRHTEMIIYNREKVSDEEADELIRTGRYEFDPRFLVTTPESVANIFPHRGESDYTGPKMAYWKPCSGNSETCECSSCGVTLPSQLAVEFGSNITDYASVKYRFCPNCGLKMSSKPEIEGK